MNKSRIFYESNKCFIKCDPRNLFKLDEEKCFVKISGLNLKCIDFVLIEKGNIYFLEVKNWKYFGLSLNDGNLETKINELIKKFIDSFFICIKCCNIKINIDKNLYFILVVTDATYDRVEMVANILKSRLNRFNDCNITIEVYTPEILKEMRLFDEII